MRAPYVRYGHGVNPITCGRKHCTGCGRWRQLVDFAAHRRDPLELQTRCRTCQRRYYAELAADPKRNQRRRAYNREWQRRRRRANGQRTWEQWVASTGKSQPILGRKHCTQCGCWRPVSDFGHHKDGMAAACMACLRLAQREREVRTKADPVAMALRREYQRIYREAERRRAGVKPRALTRPVPPDPPNSGTANGYLHRRLDSGPLRQAMLAWLREHAADHPSQPRNGHRPEHMGLQALAHASTVPERRVYGILVGEYDHTHYAVADRLAVAMDLPLAMIYEGQA